MTTEHEFEVCRKDGTLSVAVPKTGSESAQTLPDAPMESPANTSGVSAADIAPDTLAEASPSNVSSNALPEANTAGTSTSAQTAPDAPSESSTAEASPDSLPEASTAGASISPPTQPETGAADTSPYTPPETNASDAPPYTPTPPNTTAYANPILLNAASVSVPLAVDGRDRLFALLFSVIGFAFIYVFTAPYYEIFGFSTVEWLLLFFTVLYVAVVLCYARVRKVTPPVESWFWLGAMLCFVAPLPYYCSIGIFQPLGLICMAAYWTLSVADGLIGTQGRTSGFFPLDALNALVIVPFGNFFCHVRVLFHASHPENRTKFRRRALSVLLGIVLAIPLLAIVLPLLARADTAFSGIFDTLFRSIETMLHNLFGPSLPTFVVRFVVSMPVTAYLFGLAYGSLRRRHTAHFTAVAVRRSLDAAHVLPNSSVYIVQAALCAIYVLFICLQTRYLFSAFTGILPEGFTFSDYARSGFFELCRIAALNLCVLAAANAMAKTPRAVNRRLRLCNIVLSVLSILLLTTAASKMVLYIGAYGLTPLRVLSSVALLWLIFVFVACIVWQMRRFDIVRICLFTALALACILCVINVEGGCHLYNRTYNFL